MVNNISRRPISATSTEAFYRVHVVGAAEKVSVARDRLADRLQAIDDPITSIDVRVDTEDSVELAATLMATSVDSAALDRVCDSLTLSAVIDAATWTVSPTL